jgi:hypothetical protein
MTYLGHVKNGFITLDEAVVLPEGSAVKVEVLREAAGHEHQEAAPTDVNSGNGDPTTVWDRLRKLAGTVEGPEDWAKNHNHYIHGTPKLP